MTNKYPYLGREVSTCTSLRNDCKEGTSDYYDPSTGIKTFLTYEMGMIVSGKRVFPERDKKNEYLTQDEIDYYNKVQSNRPAKVKPESDDIEMISQEMINEAEAEASRKATVAGLNPWGAIR